MSDTLLQDVRRALVDDAELRGWVGSRVYPDVASQSAQLPFIVYADVSLVLDHTLAGRTDLRESRVQFDAYARTKRETLLLRERLIELLDGVHGALGDSRVLHSAVSNAQGSHDAGEGVYRQKLDINFHYTI